MIKNYMKAQKHACFHVLSPLSALIFYPPLHHNGKGPTAKAGLREPDASVGAGSTRDWLAWGCLGHHSLTETGNFPTGRGWYSWIDFHLQHLSRCLLHRWKAAYSVYPLQWSLSQNSFQCIRHFSAVCTTLSWNPTPQSDCVHFI